MLSGDDREARRTARYVDSLLAGEPLTDATLDVSLRRAARRLRADLPPVHPSFGFQEALAARLEAMARDLDGPGPQAATSPTGDTVAPLNPDPASPVIVMPVSGLPAAHRLVRPLIVGGVAASALSIGAVFVAWRLGRPSAVATAVTTTATTASTTVRAMPRGRRNAVLHGILGVVS